MPAIVANGVLSWKATPHLTLHTHLLFESRQKSYFINLKNYYQAYNMAVKALEALDVQDMDTYEYYVDRIKELIKQFNGEEEMPARCIINLGGEYTYGRFTIGLNIHNLLNTHYNRSGINTNLVPQQGRWFLATVGIKL